MPSPETFVFGEFRLSAHRRELLVRGVPAQLGSRAFDLLLALVRRQGQLATKDELMSQVWPDTVVEDNNLKVQISAIRKLLREEPRCSSWLVTIPGRGYRFVAPVEREAPAETPGETSPALGTDEAAAPPPLPDKPSIAVLPFSNLSGDLKEDYFSDGITDDIVTELSRFSELFVIARNSSFTYKGKAVDVRQVGRELGVRYVLEGSIRRAGDRVRITGQLVDATSGAHRWAERYDRELKDVFAVQDEVARTIVALLAAHVNKAEAERTLNNPPATWQAYDHYMRATDMLASFWSSFNVEQLYEARRHFQQSLLVDPNYARAYAMLSLTHLIVWINALDPDHLSPAALDQAYQLARRAVQLDPNLPLAHSQLGYVLTWKGQHEASIAGFERAMALNPNLTDWRFAAALVRAGEPERAIDVVQAHMRLDPFYPHCALLRLGAAYYQLKRYSEALEPLRECVSRAPNFYAGHTRLAATYAQLGQLQEAQAEAAEVLRINPKYTITGTQMPISSFRRPEDTELYFDGLRKAGLPEKRSSPFAPSYAPRTGGTAVRFLETKFRPSNDQSGS